MSYPQSFCLGAPFNEYRSSGNYTNSLILATMHVLCFDPLHFNLTAKQSKRIHESHPTHAELQNAALNLK